MQNNVFLKNFSLLLKKKLTRKQNIRIINLILLKKISPSVDKTNARQPPFIHIFSVPGVRVRGVITSASWEVNMVGDHTTFNYPVPLLFKEIKNTIIFKKHPLSNEFVLFFILIYIKDLKFSLRLHLEFNKRRKKMESRH